MKRLILKSVFCLLTLAGCNSSVTEDNQYDTAVSYLEEDSIAAQEAQEIMYDGEYCSRLVVSIDEGKIIGDYDVNIQAKSNKLVWLDLPESLGIDFDNYQPSDITKYGTAEILMDDGRVYKIQIGECKESNTDEGSSYIGKGVVERQVDNPVLSSINRSWAKDHFREYFEKEDIEEFISSAKSELTDLQGESEREEAESIFKFASSFSTGDVVSLKNFETAVNLLGLSYTVRYLTDDLSIIKFKFGSSFYYFMRNANSSHGYSFKVVGGNGKLTLWSESRNVSCLYLAQVEVGKVQYDDVYLQSHEPIGLCIVR